MLKMLFARLTKNKKILLMYTDGRMFVYFFFSKPAFIITFVVFNYYFFLFFKPSRLL